MDSKLPYLMYLYVRYGDESEPSHRLKGMIRNILENQLDIYKPDIWQEDGKWSYCCKGDIAYGYKSKAHAALAAAKRLWGKE